jgi:hypothetical protein
VSFSFDPGRGLACMRNVGNYHFGSNMLCVEFTIIANKVPARAIRFVT